MKLKIVAILAGLFLVAAMLIPGGSSVNVKNLYEEAEKAFQEKKYQEAIDKYTLALTEGEKWGADTSVIDEDFDSLAKYKIAVCYAELGKQLEDPTMYEKSLEYIPSIYQVTKVDKIREGVIFLWGHDYYELKQYEEAEPKFRELLNDYPDSQFAENAYYSLGNLYYELKQYESSREAFRMILTKFPNSGFIDDAQYFIARCFFDEANYDQSHMEFEKVESENTALLAQARYYDGLSLLRMGRNQDALTTYQKFVADFPNSVFIPAAYFDMGTIHGKLKEYEEATRNYEQAIQSTKDEITKSEIQFQIGNNYFDAQDYQSAIDAYRKLMDQYPQSVHISESRSMIAESYWWLKDYENALAAYTEVLDNESEGDRVENATYKIGECHYNIDNKEMALEWYQKVIDNYPDSTVVKDATYGKIWSLNDLERYEEAEQVGKDYISKYKTDPIYNIAAAETQMMLGDIKFDTENYIEAADEYLLVPSDYGDLPKFDPFKSRSLLQAGFAYYKEAERSNWDKELLSKAAAAFDKLLNDYEVNFDKEKREFESRVEYVNPAIINLGLSYSKIGEGDNARKALDMMPKNSPEYGRAMFLKGETFVDEGKVDEAVEVYRNMVNDNSLSSTWRSRAAIEMASKLRDAGRHAEAVVEYERVVQDYPDSEFVSTAMYFVGSSYYDMEPKTPENMTKAIEAFKKVQAQYPESEVAPWSHLGIVMAYESSSAYDMVIKVADEIEKQYEDSKDPEARRVVDMARRQKVDAMQKLEEGVSTNALIAELRKVVEDPVGEEEGKASAQMRIGTLLFSEKSYDKAIKEYEYMLEKFPGKYTGSAYYQIAAAAYWLEDYEKSIATAQKGLQEKDLSQELKTGLSYTLGLAYSKLENRPDSIAALNQAIQEGTGAEKEQTQDIVLAAHRELARVYTAAGQYQEAAQEYAFLTENSKTDSEKADASFWLAKTYEDNLKDYQNAVKYYEKTIELGTSDILTAQSLYYSGVLHSQLRDGEKALSSFQELTTKYAAHEDSSVKSMVSDANLRVPELLIELGKFDDAVARARKVRDDALTAGDKKEKLNAQYQLAYLLGDQAGKATESGSPDPNLSSEAATEYSKVYELARPISEADEDTKNLASASLYNAGYLLYSLGGYDNYVKAVEYFEYFTKDFRGNENYYAALEYLGFGSFEVARLKADLPGFARAAEYFLRFAREFPDRDDSAMAQFQGGESYFAVGGGHAGNAEEATDPNVKTNEVSAAISAYEKAASAYRGVADKFPSSEQAPESLYAMAACYTYIADASTGDMERQYRSRALDAYRELSEKYPQSANAASAFLSVGNDYYNQASMPGLSTGEKTDLYKKSLDSYKRALQVPGVETKTRMTVENYVKETEEFLAGDTYNAGYALVLYDMDEATKRANAPKAVPYFEEVINTLPNTDYADLSYVQLGLCYEYLEQWREAEDAYGTLIKKYMDANGNPITPFSESVVQALQFARDRKGKIMAYRLSIELQEKQQTEGQ